MKDVLGNGMAAFYGGRSETPHRLSPIECAYCDCRSHYPAVIALCGLQRFLLAEHIEVRRGPAAAHRVRTWLSEPDLLARVLDPETWPGLCVLVKIRPHGDRVPVRGKFHAGMTTANIANCFLTSGEEHWYPLADTAAGVIRTGRVPEILDAIELIPHGQVPTTPVALFGDQRFIIDLAHEDLALRLAELRADAKRQLATLPSDHPDRPRLVGVISTAKIVANALYGILVELNVQEPTEKPRTALLYALRCQEIRTTLTEKPGRYFAGPLGAFITAGGRLLVAIAEQLGIELGLQRGIPDGMRHAMADTDSITFMRPAGMERAAFWELVDEVRDRIQHLSPYHDEEDFLELEDENFALRPDERGRMKADRSQREALYAVCVSPKRYCLYNRPSDRSFVIRKFSMSGAGAFADPGGEDSAGDDEDDEPDDEQLDELDRLLEEYRSPADIPDPIQDVGTLGGGRGRRWVYDGWYRAIERVEQGVQSDTEMIFDRPELRIPAFRQVTMTTPALLAQYRHVPGIRPFSFITVPASFTNQIVHDRVGIREALDLLAQARIAAQERAEVWRQLRLAILDHGGIRPDSLGEDYRAIPASVRRRVGEPVDVMATVWGFETIDAFVRHVADTYQAVLDAQQVVDQRQRDVLAEKETALVSVPLYAPYCRTAKDLVGTVRRGDTHELIDPNIRLVTFEELYRRYFCHPNSTAADPHGIGDCGILHVHAQSIIVIGKESHPIRSDGTDVEGGRELRSHTYSAVDLSARMQRFPLRWWYEQLPDISPRHVRNLYHGTREPSSTRGKQTKGTRVLITRVLAMAEADPPPSWDTVLERMQAFTVQELHHATGLSERLLRYYKAGQSRPKGKRLTVLLAGLEALEAQPAKKQCGRGRGQVDTKPGLERGNIEHVDRPAGGVRPR